jgi:hypothetical protein
MFFIRILGISCLILIAALNFVVFLKPAKADMEPDYCFGWKYLQCNDGVMVIRCTCSGGENCYVWSQALCD